MLPSVSNVRLTRPVSRETEHQPKSQAARSESSAIAIFVGLVRAATATSPFICTLSGGSQLVWAVTYSSK
jgi:hypothetical protein